MQSEMWKTIDNFERYQISNHGRVKSLIGHEKILQQFITGNGYYTVKLSRKTNKKGVYNTKNFKVHRLVAEFFCDEFLDNMEVHHKNKIKSDNRIDNLQCLTKNEHINLHKNLKNSINGMQ